VIRALGITMMLLIGMVAWFLRYAMFALSINEETRWMIYIGIILHGVCYDFFFVIGFIFTDIVAGNKVKGPVQSVRVLFTYGLVMLMSGAVFNRSVTARDAKRAGRGERHWRALVAGYRLASVQLRAVAGAFQRRFRRVV